MRKQSTLKTILFIKYNLLNSIYLYNTNRQQNLVILG